MLTRPVHSPRFGPMGRGCGPCRDHSAAHPSRKVGTQ